MRRKNSPPFSVLLRALALVTVHGTVTACGASTSDPADDLSADPLTEPSTDPATPTTDEEAVVPAEEPVCGDEVVGLVLSGPNGVEVTITAAEPEHAAASSNQWTLQAVSPQGTPVDGGTVSLTIYDAAGDPLSDVEATATAESGVYLAGPFDLPQGQELKIDIVVSDGSDRSDTATLSLCLP